MATLSKQVNIDVTPEDIVRALLDFTPEDWHALQLEVQRLLLEENIDVSRWFSGTFAGLVPESLLLSEEPPPTPEGDHQALAAAEELFALFDDLEPELARWGATSPDLRLESSYLWQEDAD